MAHQIELDNLRKEFGSIVAVDDIDVTIPAGEFVTIVGPSGCGKTTTLRMIAGLESPSGGAIRFDGTDVTDTSPQERDLSMVFQSIALYPHMTCRENIGYGLKIRGVSESKREERIQEAAETLQIEDQLDKMPADLSGGQQQRVALGRAFVEDPDVLLLDEPMSNLDAKLKEELRVEVQRLHQELDSTLVYVTHDQNEAMTMSDRIILMRDGDISQFAGPEELFHQPASEYAATFIGTPSTNVLEFTVQGDEAVRDAHRFTLPEAARSINLDTVRVGVRPQYFALDDTRDVTVDVEIDVIEPLGTEYVVHARTIDDETQIHVVTDDITSVASGETTTISADRGEVYLFDETGETITFGETTKQQLEAP